MRARFKMSSSILLRLFLLFSIVMVGCGRTPIADPPSPSKAPPAKVSVADMTDEQVKFQIRRLTEKNELVKAIEMLEERLVSRPDDLELRQLLVATKIRHGEAIARLGDLKSAAEIMKEVGVQGREIFSGDEEGASRVDYVAALLCEARAFAFESNVEACVAALQEAVEHGFGKLALLEKDPFFRTLRSSAEYSEMVDKMLEANATKSIREFTPVDYEFELEDLSGKKVKLADSNGKVRVVDVWGTWCAPCLSEIPSFIRLQNSFPDDLEVIGVSVERVESEVEARRLVQAVVDGSGINYTCLIGNEKTTQDVPGFKAFPTTLIIDREGKVRLRLDGTQSYDKLHSVVEYLVSEGN